MGINFGALNKGPGPEQAVHPRDIFNALPNKPRGMDYLRGPQDQVLQEWWNRRRAQDLVIKMNTGGGKTVVGLLVAQSSLAEGAGPAAYLVPDHYLAAQVRAEARRLGIAVTDNARDMDYARGRAILVDVFQRLFNGRSVFGVDGSAGRAAAVPAPGTIVIDDAHACLGKAEQAFRLTVPSDNPAYDKLLVLFQDAIEQQSPASYLDLADGRSRAVQMVPYWAWIDRQRPVLETLHPLSGDEPYIFAWPLLVDILPDCRAVFTADSLEIAAPCVNSDVLPGFRQARRRTYLTATLADDGVLVTDFGADADQVEHPIVPANAGDIGDRLIMVPQQTHPAASEGEIREVILGLAGTRNDAVIVPSDARAAYWRDDATMVLNKDNLAAGVEAMRADSASGLYVFVNRYDGVDLPGDACHVLVIDGLPEALGGIERADAAYLSGTRVLTARQVQRLEQGMGRATRSNEDYCVVFLLGARLAERLHGPAARASFSPATRAQIELSEDVEGLIAGTDVSTLRQAAEQCLDRDPDWLAASRGRLATLRYGDAVVTSFARASREAFGHATAKDYRAAVAELQEAVNGSSDSAVSAYLRQQLAAYQHHFDPTGAQQTQKSANGVNRKLLRPLEGVRYEKLSAPAYAQGAASSAYLQGAYGAGNDLVIGLNALLGDLDWGPRTGAFAGLGRPGTRDWFRESAARARDRPRPGRSVGRRWRNLPRHRGQERRQGQPSGLQVQRTATLQRDGLVHRRVHDSRDGSTRLDPPPRAIRETGGGPARLQGGHGTEADPALRRAQEAGGRARGRRRVSRSRSSRQAPDIAPPDRRRLLGRLRPAGDPGPIARTAQGQPERHQGIVRQPGMLASRTGLGPYAPGGAAVLAHGATEKGADSRNCRNTRSFDCCDELSEERSGGLPAEGLAGAVVEFGGDGGEVFGGVDGQVGAFREVLAE